jgi:hypothetical protein
VSPQKATASTWLPVAMAATVVVVVVVWLRPLTNPVWVYGDDDDTLFRVIALGTGKLSPGDAFAKFGYKRKGSEGVVGPMPYFGEVIKSDDDLWKIIAWMRTVDCRRRASGC